MSIAGNHSCAAAANHEEFSPPEFSGLEEFGTLPFEMAKSGGKPTEYALLNEEQATLHREIDWGYQ